jgi:hypothetical protein
MRYTIPIWFPNGEKAALSGIDRPDTHRDDARSLLERNQSGSLLT